MGCCNCKPPTETEPQFIYNPSKVALHTIKETPRFVPHITYAYVASVYDGDTVTILAPVLNTKGNTVYKYSVRIYGVDCPELRTTDEVEKSIALKAKEFAINTLRNKHVELKNISYDKYGRLLANIYIEGKHYNHMLLQNGLAYEYFGKTKSPPENWKEYYETAQHILQNKRNKSVSINTLTASTVSTTNDS